MNSDKECFIDKWRAPLGCEHDPYSEELCWCVYCQALEKIWQEKRATEPDSIEAIRQTAGKYLETVVYYDLGKISAISAEEFMEVAALFFPDGRVPGLNEMCIYSDTNISDDQGKVKHFLRASISINLLVYSAIRVMGTDCPKYKTEIVLKNPVRR
jgi:hypothetical protein